MKSNLRSESEGGGKGERERERQRETKTETVRFEDCGWGPLVVKWGIEAGKCFVFPISHIANTFQPFGVMQDLNRTDLFI